jgi:hypothetical protein
MVKENSVCCPRIWGKTQNILSLLGYGEKNEDRMGWTDRRHGGGKEMKM